MKKMTSLKITAKVLAASGLLVNFCQKAEAAPSIGEVLEKAQELNNIDIKSEKSPVHEASLMYPEMAIDVAEIYFSDENKLHNKSLNIYTVAGVKKYAEEVKSLYTKNVKLQIFIAQLLLYRRTSKKVCNASYESLPELCKKLYKTQYIDEILEKIFARLNLNAGKLEDLEDTVLDGSKLKPYTLKDTVL